jgi:hypothetical protein
MSTTDHEANTDSQALLQPNEVNTNPSTGLLTQSRDSFSSDNEAARPIANEDSEGIQRAVEVSYWQCICLVISRQVGAGIFSTCSILNGNAGSIGMALILWFIAGCIAYAGACSKYIPYSISL